MITETSAVAFRQNLGEMLNIVQYRNDSVLIKKDGKPVAALIDARLFERIRRMQERFDALCDRLAGAAPSGVKVPQPALLHALKEAGWVDMGRLKSREYDTKKHIFCAPDMRDVSKSELRRRVEDVPTPQSVRLVK
jgi:prevent-host-death family protein